MGLPLQPPGILDGKITALISLGGNFIRAVPETVAMERAWRNLPLTVQILTKLNRSAIAGANLRAEAQIIAGLAQATLDANEKVAWRSWTDNYAMVREAIAETYPAIFADFNLRIATSKGFDRPNPARDRIWKTNTAKANFIAPNCLSEDPDLPRRHEDVLTLITVRSNDQFNATIYGDNDRLRGIHGTRMVVLMHEDDMNRFGIADGETVDLVGAAGDGVERFVRGFRATRYNVPRGSCAGYYPECNPLLPLWHHAARSHVPAAKSIPVRIRKVHSADSAR